MDSIPRRIAVQTCKTAARSRWIKPTFTPVLVQVLIPSNRHNLSTSLHRSALPPRPSQRTLHPNVSFPLHRLFHTTTPRYSQSEFTYGIAASFSAKDTRYEPRHHTFHFDSSDPIPAERKTKHARPSSGQDAFFVARIGDGSSGDIALGVADGVGGWADSGVDPADFSHGFCEHMARAASSHASPSPKRLTARTLMQTGYDAITSDHTVQAGGSTACVAIATGDGSLEVANLGDSGFVQLRLNAVHQCSTPQTHAFNTPYQLSLIPEAMRAKNAAFGGVTLHDVPGDAAVTSHALRGGDVLVFATDGVWDNLSPSDVLRVVSRLMLGARAWVLGEDGVRVGERLAAFTARGDGDGVGRLSSLQSFVAVGIAGEAKAASMNTKVDGPFAKEVQRWYPEEDWRGGKVDDICVVVAIVVENGR